MNQQWLIKNVLKHQHSVPTTPDDDREYLSLDQAQSIVDDTIDELGAHGDDTEYTYINGHRKRLAHSLTMIPKARGAGESCLDVGSYGYMAFWASKHLGYDKVVGIEWHPDIDDRVIVRSPSLHSETVEITSHNFDISQPDWPELGEYDTVLFFEVLEHINHDPMGVMKRIHSRLKPAGTLVMSVPNVISYKAFKEFLVGMPPWTYWFYEPDLSHEPRHCFEYTPIVFKALIRATGLQENAFRTIYAYSDPEHEQGTLEIARSLGFDEESFGETMIINATKVSSKINLRHPDVLYSPEGYYKNVFPHLQERLDHAIESFRQSRRVPEPVEDPDPNPGFAPEAVPELIDAVRALAEERDRNDQLRTRLDEAKQSTDEQATSVADLEVSLGKLGAQNDVLSDESHQTQDHANDLQRQKHELEARVNELLFTCDGYLQAQNENDRAAQAVVESVRAELDEAHRARDAAITEAKDTRNWAENLSRDNSELSAQVNELLFTCDCYLKKETEVEPKLAAITVAKDAALTEAKDTRAWAENLSKDNSDLKGQVNELLFACDCYLQQVNDPARCVQVVREKRFRSALRVSKSVARKTPVLRTALRPVYRSTKKFIKRRM